MAILANIVIVLTVVMVLSMIFKRPNFGVAVCFAQIFCGFTLAMGVLGLLPEVRW